MTAEYAPPAGSLEYKLDRDLFLVKQKQLTLGSSKYYVSAESGEDLFFAERPVMRLFGRRADIVIHDDDTKAAAPALTLKQDHGYEFLKREYTLVDANDQVIARLRRDNIKALFRRTWILEDAGGTPIGRALENSAFMSFVRRLVDWIPFVSLIGWAIKTDFDILAENGAGERKIGSFNRKFGITDSYVLDLRDDTSRSFDRRIAVGLGILLDTAEAR